jgi:hypothetical protein
VEANADADADADPDADVSVETCKLQPFREIPERAILTPPFSVKFQYSAFISFMLHSAVNMAAELLGLLGFCCSSTSAESASRTDRCAQRHTIATDSGSSNHQGLCKAFLWASSQTSSSPFCVQVYKASYLHCDVAVKRLNRTNDAKSEEKFRNECAILKGCRYPHIVNFMGVCKDKVCPRASCKLRRFPSANARDP